MAGCVKLKLAISVPNLVNNIFRRGILTIEAAKWHTGMNRRGGIVHCQPTAGNAL